MSSSVQFVVVLFALGTHAKIYERCELAKELRDEHEFPVGQIATWLCIANYESHFDTSAHNPGSGDHGLFQISELFWCSPPGTGDACGLSCADLRNDDIGDDAICARRIYRQHQRISGDGFTAWVVYNLHCRNAQRVESFLQGCFDTNKNLTKSDSLKTDTTTKKVKALTTLKPKSRLDAPILTSLTTTFKLVPKNRPVTTSTTTTILKPLGTKSFPLTTSATSVKTTTTLKPLGTKSRPATSATTTTLKPLVVKSQPVTTSSIHKTTSTTTIQRISTADSKESTVVGKLKTTRQVDAKVLTIGNDYSFKWTSYGFSLRRDNA